MNGAQVDDPFHAGGRLQGGGDGGDLLRYRGLADQQAGGLAGEKHRDPDEQGTDAQGGDAVEDAVAGQHAQPDAEQGEGETEQRAAVLEQDHRQFGSTGAAYKMQPTPRAAGAVGLADGGAQGVALQRGCDEQYGDGDQRRGQRMRIDDLVVALVQRVQPAEGEQNDSHQEGVDVTGTGVAERMQRRRRLPGTPAADEQQHLVA